MCLNEDHVCESTTVRTVVRVSDPSAFVEKFRPWLDERYLLLPGALPRREGTSVRFTVASASGALFLAGTATVVRRIPRGDPRGCPPGILVAYQADADTQPLVDWIRESQQPGDTSRLRAAIEGWAGKAT